MAGSFPAHLQPIRMMGRNFQGLFLELCGASGLVRGAHLRTKACSLASKLLLGTPGSVPFFGGSLTVSLKKMHIKQATANAVCPPTNFHEGYLPKMNVCTIGNEAPRWPCEEHLSQEKFSNPCSTKGLNVPCGWIPICNMGQKSFTNFLCGANLYFV